MLLPKHPGVGTPDNLRVVPVKEKNTARNYLLIDKVEDLISLAQIGALEIHVWGSEAEKLEFPDRMVFDLDPDPAVRWPQVIESAHQIRLFLKELGLESFVKTTGGKGLHIVVPLQRRQDWDEVKAFSKAVAEFIRASRSLALYVQHGQSFPPRKDLHRLSAKWSKCNVCRCLFDKGQATSDGFGALILGRVKRRRSFRYIYHPQLACAFVLPEEGPLGKNREGPTVVDKDHQEQDRHVRRRTSAAWLVAPLLLIHHAM